MACIYYHNDYYFSYRHACQYCNRHILYIGGADVLARLPAQRNADQPYFEDINMNLQNEWLDIWLNLTDEEQTAIAQQSGPSAIRNPAAYQNAWETEQRQAFSDMMQVLTCRVVSQRHNV